MVRTKTPQGGMGLDCELASHVSAYDLAFMLLAKTLAKILQIPLNAADAIIGSCSELSHSARLVTQILSQGEFPTALAADLGLITELLDRSPELYNSCMRTLRMTQLHRQVLAELESPTLIEAEPAPAPDMSAILDVNEAIIRLSVLLRNLAEIELRSKSSAETSLS